MTLKLIEERDVGDSVMCDDCGREYRGDPTTGGILFQSKAICPSCAPKWERDARTFGETSLIRGRCPDGQSFHSWVMGLRGGNNTVRTYSGSIEDLN